MSAHEMMENTTTSGRVTRGRASKARSCSALSIEAEGYRGVRYSRLRVCKWTGREVPIRVGPGLVAGMVFE